MRQHTGIFYCWGWVIKEMLSIAAVAKNTK